VERVAFECVRHLLAQGHNVKLVCESAATDELTPLLTSPSQLEILPVRLGRVPWFLRGRRFFDGATRILDKVGTPRLNTHGCICPTKGVMWVQSIHVAWLEMASKLNTSFSPRSILRRLNPVHRQLLNLERQHFRERAYRRLIVTTEQVANDLLRHYDVPRDHMSILPNGYNTDEFNPVHRTARRETMRRRLGYGEDDIVLLFAGNELDRKGFEPTCKAIARLGNRKVKLLVVGRASMAMAGRIARRCAVGDAVQLCGATSDMSGFYSAADFLVLPTQYEALALTIIEALASGLPVITSNVPGARDTIQSEVNGLLVDNPLDDVAIAEAIERMGHQDVRQRMSAAAPGTVAHLAWSNILPQFERLFVQAYE
jgi:glycosyltransferase involved in cell wall biosynthesis